MKEFCTEIGTTHITLKAATQWADRAELFIGFLKEATRKDLRETGSPIVRWDYCMERREADLVDGAGKPIMMHSLTDTLINAELLLSKDDSAAIARVARRAVDSKGKMIGTWDENPILNTLVYECEFEDGTIREYAANTIASNIYEEGNADGFSSTRLFQIMEHKSSGEAIKMKDKYFIICTGTRRMRNTTVGWSFLVQWGDGSRQWIDLKVLKESNPVQVGEYVIARGIADEPAFAW